MKNDPKDLKAHTPSYEARKVIRELLPFVLLGWVGIIGAIVAFGLLIAVVVGAIL